MGNAAQVQISKEASQAIGDLAAGKALAAVALEALKEKVNDLTPEQRDVLQGLAVTSGAAVRFEAQAVRLLVDGKPFHLDVPHQTFGPSREQQEELAKVIGAEVASRAATMALVSYLFAKEETGDLAPNEVTLLQVYRTGFVRDQEGGVRAGLRRGDVHVILSDADGYPNDGALLMRAVEEAK